MSRVISIITSSKQSTAQPLPSKTPIYVISMDTFSVTILLRCISSRRTR